MTSTALSLLRPPAGPVLAVVLDHLARQSPGWYDPVLMRCSGPDESCGHGVGVGLRLV